MPEISTKPYLIRAIYEWCTDSGYTPHIAVSVDSTTQVPMQFVKNGEIVLNISFGATSGLKMDNDSIRFNARFGGVAREIFIPMDNIIAIYANENGQGMVFEVVSPAQSGQDIENSVEQPQAEVSQPASLSAVPPGDPNAIPPDDSPEPPKNGGRPTLTRIK